MKNNKKILSSIGSIIGICSLVVILFLQASNGVTEIFAKEVSLSLKAKSDISKLETGENFTVTIEDLRSASKAVPVQDDTSLLANHYYTTNADDQQNLLKNSAKRQWVMVLPDGVSFNQSYQDESLQGNAADRSDATFSYNEETKQLTITSDITVTKADVVLIADAAGEYELNVKDKNIPNTDSEKLKILIAKSSETSVKEAKTLPTPRDAPVEEGTAVTNWVELVRAFVNPNVSTISIANDFAVPDRPLDGLTDIAIATQNANPSGSYNYFYPTVANISRKLTINGNGHTVDFGAVVLAMRDVNTKSGSNWDITFNDFTVYAGNWYSFFTMVNVNVATQQASKMTYNNMNIYGNQMTSSYYTNTVISGTVTNITMENYTSPFRANFVTSPRAAVNVETGKLTVAQGSTLNLTSANSGNLILGLDGQAGQMTLEKDAVVNIDSNGTYVRPNVRSTGPSVDIRGSVILNENAKMNIKTNRPYSAIYVSAAGSSLEIGKNTEVNIDSSGNTQADAVYRNIVYMQAGSKITTDQGGKLGINATNRDAGSGSIVYINGNATFKIGKNGVLDIKDDSINATARLIHLQGAGSLFQFADAQRVNLQKTRVISSPSSATNGLIYSAGGKLDVSVQNVYQWTMGNLTNGADGNSGYSYAYEPMSSMMINYSSVKTTIVSANSMTNAVLNNFKNNFTTNMQQRVLFTRIPDPSVSIKSVANDNPADPGSITVSGFAVPGTYVRIWEEALNGTTSAKSKGVGDTVTSPVEDTTMPSETRNNYTVKADAEGNWTYTIPAGNHFSAGNIIHAYGFANLKSEEVTQTVLDKTPPTGEGLSYYASVGAALPDPSAFVTNVEDTNPITQTFTYAYADQAAVEDLMTTENTEGTLVDILVADEAGNQATIQGKLIVYGQSSAIYADSPLELSYIDIREMTEAQLKAYILAQSHPNAYSISEGIKTNWDDLEKFSVTDLGALSNLTTITPDTEYPVQITLPKTISLLEHDLTTTVKIKVINMDAHLTIEFADESGTVLSGYTLKAGAEESNDIVTNLYVSDVIDLTSATYQGVQDQLAALETAGYEIATRPVNENSLSITQTTQTVTYTVKGLLFLNSAPETVDFGNLTYDAKVQRIDNPSADYDLVVTDTRADKHEGWTLYASLSTEMKNSSTGSIMSDALRYVNTSHNEIILNTGNQPIYNSTSGGTYNISNDWGSSALDSGLKLVADPRKTTVSSVGKYSGVITWTIIAGQP